MTRKELIHKYGSVAAASRKLGINVGTLKNRLDAYDDHRARKNLGGNGIQKTFGKNLKDFRTKFDKTYTVPLKIKEALKKLGSSAWEYELGFAKLAGISVADLVVYRDRFADHIVEVRGKSNKKVWAGSPAMAQRMKSLLSAG